MNPPELFTYLQLGIFILGVLTILIAGYQDKKTRTAPAIYLTPTLIGFGLNIGLGLIGLIITIITIFFWKEKWNETFGLADALLYVAIFMCLTNPITLLFVIPINVGVIIELTILKNAKVPLIWVYAKWITIILILAVLFLLLAGA